MHFLLFAFCTRYQDWTAQSNIPIYALFSFSKTKRDLAPSPLQHSLRVGFFNDIPVFVENVLWNIQKHQLYVANYWTLQRSHFQQCMLGKMSQLPPSDQTQVKEEIILFSCHSNQQNVLNHPDTSCWLTFKDLWSVHAPLCDSGFSGITNAERQPSGPSTDSRPRTRTPARAVRRYSGNAAHKCSPGEMLSDFFTSLVTSFRIRRAASHQLKAADQMVKPKKRRENPPKPVCESENHDEKRPMSESK